MAETPTPLSIKDTGINLAESSNEQALNEAKKLFRSGAREFVNSTEETGQLDKAELHFAQILKLDENDIFDQDQNLRNQLIKAARAPIYLKNVYIMVDDCREILEDTDPQFSHDIKDSVLTRLKELRRVTQLSKMDSPPIFSADEYPQSTQDIVLDTWKQSWPFIEEQFKKFLPNEPLDRQPFFQESKTPVLDPETQKKVATMTIEELNALSVYQLIPLGPYLTSSQLNELIDRASKPFGTIERGKLAKQAQEQLGILVATGALEHNKAYQQLTDTHKAPLEEAALKRVKDLREFYETRELTGEELSSLTGFELVEIAPFLTIEQFNQLPKNKQAFLFSNGSLGHNIDYRLLSEEDKQKIQQTIQQHLNKLRKENDQESRNVSKRQPNYIFEIPDHYKGYNMFALSISELQALGPQLKPSEIRMVKPLALDYLIDQGVFSPDQITSLSVNPQFRADIQGFATRLVDADQNTIAQTLNQLKQWMAKNPELKGDDSAELSLTALREAYLVMQPFIPESRRSKPMSKQQLLDTLNELVTYAEQNPNKKSSRLDKIPILRKFTSEFDDDLQDVYRLAREVKALISLSDAARYIYDPDGSQLEALYQYDVERFDKLTNQQRDFLRQRGIDAPHKPILVEKRQNLQKENDALLDAFTRLEKGEITIDDLYYVPNLGESAVRENERLLTALESEFQRNNSLQNEQDYLNIVEEYIKYYAISTDKLVKFVTNSYKDTYLHAYSLLSKHNLQINPDLPLSEVYSQITDSLTELAKTDAEARFVNNRLYVTSLIMRSLMNK